MQQPIHLRVFLSCPGDCIPDREFVKSFFARYNVLTAHARGFHFDTVDWNQLAPTAGAPQEVVDREIGQYDIFLGFMWRRFGTPLPGEWDSGTAHEVRAALKRCQELDIPRVMLYFNTTSEVPSEAADSRQLERLREFSDEMWQRLLPGQYERQQDLEGLLQSHFDQVLEDLAEARCHFVHGLATADAFLPLIGATNPYASVLASGDGGEAPTLLLFPHFPAQSKLQQPAGTLLSASAICTVDAERARTRLETWFESSREALASRRFSDLSRAAKQSVLDRMAGCFVDSFVVAADFGDFRRQIADTTDALSYQLMVDHFLVPLLSFHKELGFRRLQVHVPDVGPKAPLFKTIKKIVPAVFPRSQGNAEVHLMEPASPWQVFAEAGKVVDWVVGNYYRSGQKNKEWIARLGKAFKAPENAGSPSTGERLLAMV